MAVVVGLLTGCLAVRHRPVARWNTVAGLTVPALFVVCGKTSTMSLLRHLFTSSDDHMLGLELILFWRVCPIVIKPKRHDAQHQ